MIIQKDLWSFYEKHVSHTMVILWKEWYHSLLWGDSIRKGADLEKQNGLFGVHPAVMGKLTSLSIKGRVSIPENMVSIEGPYSYMKSCNPYNDHIWKTLKS